MVDAQGPAHHPVAVALGAQARDPPPPRAAAPRPAAIRAKARALSHGSSGIAADGEAPGWARAIRALSAPRKIRK